MSLASVDPEIHAAIAAELGREWDTPRTSAGRPTVSVLAAAHPLYPED